MPCSINSAFAECHTFPGPFRGVRRPDGLDVAWTSASSSREKAFWCRPGSLDQPGSRCRYWAGGRDSEGGWACCPARGGPRMSRQIQGVHLLCAWTVRSTRFERPLRLVLSLGAPRVRDEQVARHRFHRYAGSWPSGAVRSKMPPQRHRLVGRSTPSFV